MTPATQTSNRPDAPDFLPRAAANQWNSTFDKALKQAQIDLPGNETGQRAAALKAANALIAVPAPTSADEIDKLEPWQVLVRELRTIKGVLTKICVTVDGRKYAFSASPNAKPASNPAPKDTAKSDGKKDDETK